MIEDNDLLLMDKINALPHPLMIRGFSHDYWWPVIDIEVQTGLYRIDVCGMVECRQMSSCGQIMDGSGKVHYVDEFYVDYEEEKQ